MNDTTITDPLRGQNLEVGLKKTGLVENGTQHLQYMKSEERIS
jgi:hypothetical protein